MAIMNNVNRKDLILTGMKFLNFVIVFYIAMIIFWCVRGFIIEGSSRILFTQIGPSICSYEKIPILTILLYISVICMMDVKTSNVRFIPYKIIFELFVSLLIIFLINFNYSGIFLLISAEMISYLKRTREKYTLVALMLIIYFITGSEIVGMFYNAAPLDAYLAYYQANTRLFIMGSLEILYSMNIFFFLIFLVITAIDETREKENVIYLNNTLKSLNKQLKVANVRLEEYALQSQEMAKTQERNRLAREIHDTLGHTLTGIISGLDACEVLIDAAPEVAKNQIKTVAEVARRGMLDVRRSVKALRPDALEKFKLNEAIINCIKEAKEVTGCDISYVIDADLNVFNESEQDTIYRIVQESITNSIRHGHAKKIDIDIKTTSSMLYIRITDDGEGCKNIKKGFGLSHMEERISLLKGSVEFFGDDGFTIIAKIPIRNGE